MTEFLKWRYARGLSQIQAALALGLSRRIVQYYDSGEQPLPEKVRLAMAHLAEHPEKLKEPLPLTDLQRRTLETLIDGRTHKLDRKVGNALVRRKLAWERSGGFAITPAGRSQINRGAAKH